MDILSNVLLKLKSTQRIAAEMPQALSYEVANQKRWELRKGLMGGDTGMHFYLSPDYAEYKSKLPSYQAAWGVVDLYVTGRYAKSIVANYRNGVYTLGHGAATPPYAAAVDEKFEQPEGLTDTGEFIVIERIGKKMAREINKIWTK